MRNRFAWYLFLLAPALASAQPLKLESLDKLAAKASETVNANLDGSLLRLASRFLSSNDADEVQVKKIVAGLKGVYVRNYAEERPGCSVCRQERHRPTSRICSSGLSTARRYDGRDLCGQWWFRAIEE